MSAYAAAIPCPVCLHIGAFNTVQALKDRLIFVSTNKIVCPVCQEEVVGLDKLTIHLFSHVNITAIAKDDARQKDSKQRAIQENLDVQKQKQTLPKNKLCATAAAPVKFVKIYPKLPAVALNAMPVINSNVTNNSMLITTLTSDGPTDESHNRCNICGVQFINEEILKMHNSIIHNFEDKNTQPTKYNCHLCCKYFRMRGSLMVHLRVAHYGFAQQKHESESKVENGDQKVTENIEDSEKPCNFARNVGKHWQCDVCNKYFTTKYFLKKHKRLHTGETPYACSQCNKTFTFQQSYHKHLLYHNDDKPHTCSYCGRAFKELSTLHNHQRIHTGEKPFACETCGKCFRQRVSYLVHRRIHTGVMPYKCSACNKTFRYKVSQRTHKCPLQLPGAVVRKSEDFVEKLSKTERSSNSSYKSQKDQFTCSGFSEVSEVNAELIRSGAQISLEDMESENFSIIPENIAANSYELYVIKDGNSNQEINNSLSTEIVDEVIDSVPVHEKNVPSPSDILKNLCLSNEDDYLDIHD